jgi:hypothetical protein
MYGARAKMAICGPRPGDAGCVSIDITIRVAATVVVIVVVIVWEGLFVFFIIIWSVLISLDLARVKPTYCEPLSLSQPSLELSSEPDSDSPEDWSSSESSSSYSASMLVSGVAVRED